MQWGSNEHQKEIFQLLRGLPKIDGVGVSMDHREQMADLLAWAAMARFCIR